MKKIILFVVFIFPIFICAQTVCFNEVNNNTAVGTPTLQSISESTSGDFNNDGFIDVVIPSMSGLILFTNDGNSNFTASQIGSGGTNGITKNDLNGDGNLDLVVGYYGISVYLGNGNGTFNPPAVISFTTDGPVNKIVIEDLDSDGIQDMIVRDNSNIKSFKGISPTSYSVASTYTFSNLHSFAVGNYNSDLIKDIIILADTKVFLYNGLANFLFSSTLLFNFVTETPMDLLTEDLNGDSKPDLVMTLDDDKIVTYIGTGTGSYNLFSTLPALSSGRYMKSGDFNNDNILDFITAKGFQFFGIGNGGFGSFNNYSMSSINRNFEVINCNNDNYDDVVYVERINGTTVDNFKIGLADANGEIICPKEFMVDKWPYGLAIGDFNHDSIKDIVTANYLGKQLTVLNGYTQGDFNSITSYSLNNIGQADRIEKIDFNNDGLDDFCITGYNSGYTNSYGYYNGSSFNNVDFGIYSPYGGNSCFGDLNNDGILDVCINDSYDFLFALGTGGGSVNGGFVDNSFGSGLNKIMIKDATNDGINDILISGVTIFPGLGSGVFSYTPVVIGTANYLQDFDVAYINNDNMLDIVSSSSVGINYYQSTGGSSYNMSTILSYSLTKIKIADINADGNQDVIGLKGNKISILLGDGLGVFGTPILVDVLSAYSFDLGDMNNDGLLDIAVTDTYNNSVRVLINTTSKIKSSSSGNIICSNSTITLSAPLDSYSYNWQSSSGTSMLDTLIINTAGIYTLTTVNNNGTCISSSTISISSLPSPTLNIVTSSGSICIGSSATLTASGANSYTWSTGAMSPSISVTPTATSIYTATGANFCGPSTQTIGVVVDLACQDVWPGDANSDGAADNLDVLELGLHYTQTGSPRVITSNNWQAYFSNNWTGTITNGKNLNHSDCNGDGTINDNDTLAIYNNYGLTHAFKPAQATAVNPQLSIVPDQAAVVKGTWGTASIYLGDATASVSNINGVAFTIDFDNTLIETNSIYIVYQNSFLDAGQNLNFRKLDFTNGKIFTASTHTINSNVSGFGKIATLHYQIKSTLTSAQVLNLGILQANQSDASGIISPLTSGSGSLTATTDVGLQELSGNVVSIRPNPTNGSLTIHSKTELQKIEVVAITGQILLSEIPTNVSHTLNLDNFANGIYFVNLYQNNRIVKREKVVLNK
jgi:hypothetical protein